MKSQTIIAIQNIFSSRLDTLGHLLDVAESHFADDVQSLLQSRIAPDMLPFGTQGLYVELPGFSYVDDFLMPNFYFHMTTAYDILRMAGVPIGKRDFMMHFVPLIKHQGDSES